MSSSSSNLDFVAIGLRDADKEVLLNLIDEANVKFVETKPEFDDFIDNFELDGKSTLFVGDRLEELSAVELGQSLRASFVNANIVYLSRDTNDFSVSDLKKNGYSKALILPMDKTFFEDVIINSSRGGVRKKYKAVKILDIGQDEDLGFSIYYYMPANKKYSLLTPEGALSEKKITLLKKKSETIVFVEFHQAEKFYEYIAKKIAQLSDGKLEEMSETERVGYLRNSIQGLFHNIFDQKLEVGFDTGKDLLEQSHKVVQKFIETKTKIKLKEQIDNIFDVNSDSYSHAQATSSLACLLSMATKIGDPSDLALAGLFHDLSLSDMTYNPTLEYYENLSDKEKETYKKHPMESINFLKKKKMVLTPAVREIIEKHHERIDGKGFPLGLVEHRIPLPAQLLAFCDWYEYLMKVVPGQTRLTPLEIVEIIKDRAGLSLELILRVKRVFEDFEEEKSA